jgi:hypothetical protein
MAYQIRKYNGDVLLTLEDGHTDSAHSSLTLIGKNVTNFGKSQNENLIHLLENFASNTEPSSQVTGQIWYDTSQSKLKVWNGGGWIGLTQLDYMDTVPTASRAGQLWFNTDTNQLYMNVGTSGNDFKFIGPDLVPGFGVTRLASASLHSTSDVNPYIPVIKITVNDEILGIISANTFTLAPSNLINGFPTSIKRGITFSTLTDFQLDGRSTYSDLATTATNLGSGLSGQIPYQVDTGITGYTNVGSYGDLLVSSNEGQPLFTNPNNISVGYSNVATNLASGSVGSLPYQSAANSTNQLALGTSGHFLTAGLTGPAWTNPNSLSVGQSTTAIQANSLKDSESSNYFAASVNATANTIVQRASDGKVYADTFTGNLIGNVTGVASMASKLQTPRTISLTGATVGSVTFDGSSNVTMATTAGSPFSPGMILMWAGSGGGIPVGWVFCDGSNGTPDLRDRFIVGSGRTFSTGAQGGNQDAVLLKHYHIYSDYYTSANGVYVDPASDNSNTAVRVIKADGPSHVSKTTSIEGTIDSVTNGNLPPYYALAFIMKT